MHRAVEKTDRLDYLDGLRGLAALAVVVQHAAQMVHDEGIAWFAPVLETVNLGRFGVVLFFLISGFVIPFSFRGPRPLQGFAVSRLFRLFPVYWLSVAVLSCVAALTGPPPGLVAMLANLTMLQGFWGIANIGPGYWTLQFEVVFYITCALLFASGALGSSRINGVVALMALLVALLPFSGSHPGGDFITMGEQAFFLAMFFIGMLLRRVAIEGCAQARAWAVLLVPLAVLAGGLLGGLSVPVPANGNIYFQPLALASAMALPVVAFVAVLAWQPQVPPAVLYLGAISYSLYLFQDVGLLLLPFVLPPGTAPLAYFLGVLVVSLGLAALIHRTLEQPMIALGRRLNRTLAQRAAPLRIS